MEKTLVQSAHISQATRIEKCGLKRMCEGKAIPKRTWGVQLVLINGTGAHKVWGCQSCGRIELLDRIGQVSRFQGWLNDTLNELNSRMRHGERTAEIATTGRHDVPVKHPSADSIIKEQEKLAKRAKASRPIQHDEEE